MPPELTPETFLDDPYYASAWVEKFRLYPELRGQFRLHEGEGCDALVLAGGAGWGKTTLGRLRLLYAVTRAIVTDSPKLLELPEGAQLLFLVTAKDIGVAREALNTLEDAVSMVPALARHPGAVRYSPSELRFGNIAIRGCKPAERPVGFVAGGLMEYESRESFLSLRSRMRDALKYTTRGSLTWCTDAPQIIADDNTRQVTLPSWGSRPYEAAEYGSLWVCVNHGTHVASLERRSYRPDYPSESDWHRVPRSYEREVERLDLPEVLSKFFGFPSV